MEFDGIKVKIEGAVLDENGTVGIMSNLSFLFPGCQF